MSQASQTYPQTYHQKPTRCSFEYDAYGHDVVLQSRNFYVASDPSERLFIKGKEATDIVERVERLENTIRQLLAKITELDSENADLKRQRAQSPTTHRRNVRRRLE